MPLPNHYVFSSSFFIPNMILRNPLRIFGLFTITTCIRSSDYRELKTIPITTSADARSAIINPFGQQKATIRPTPKAASNMPKLVPLRLLRHLIIKNTASACNTAMPFVTYYGGI